MNSIPLLKKSKTRPGCYVYLDEQDSILYDKIKNSIDVNDLFIKQILEEKAMYCKENLVTYLGVGEFNG